MDWTWGWTALYAIATCVLAAGVGVAIWQLIVTRKNEKEQLEATRKSINAQTALEVFRELRNPETVETLREIYELTQDDLQDMPIEKSKRIDHLIDKYAALEVWVDKGIIDKEIAIEVGPPALRCWYRLRSYIENTRNQRGYYGDNFEALARLALDHFHKNKMRVKFWPAGHKDKGVNLVTKLQDKRIRPRNLEEIKKDREKP
jgi:hypothetical protein